MTKYCYLDTHIAINIARDRVAFLSKNAKRIIESTQVLLSPAVELELAYLYELDRIKLEPNAIVAFLANAIGAQTCDLSFREVSYHSRSLSWTRDVFDRLIVGQAIAKGQATLITLDKLIQENYSRALA